MLEKLLLAIMVTFSAYLSVETSWLDPPPRPSVVQQLTIPEPSESLLL
ncbi:MAG TPA: hypothetical protein V6D30_14775 [Leptolyngbyaceae cyanobacterium]|jgi:hypothetical protein